VELPPNNEATSRHEEVFDGIFWIVETLALSFGIWILLAKHLAEWGDGTVLRGR
jgi:hypothetical protein